VVVLVLLYVDVHVDGFQFCDVHEAPPGWSAGATGWFRFARPGGEGFQSERIDEEVSAGDLVRGCAEKDLLDRQLELLSGSVARHAGHLVDGVGHVSGRECRAQLASYVSAETVVQVGAGADNDEEHQLSVAPGGVLEVHDQAVVDLGKFFDDAVELRRTEPDAAAVERRVRSSGDGD
jgi:hypothetical protein